MNTPSVEPVLKSRLLPRVSFRMMIAITTVSAILAALARAAGNGSQFGYAFLAGPVFLLVGFLLFQLVFLLAWTAARFRQATALVAAVLAIALIFAELSAGFGPPLIGGWPLAAFCLVASLVLLLRGDRRRVDIANSPFAADQLPPQILPPREPTQ